METYFFILPLLNIFLCAGLAALALKRNLRNLTNVGFSLGMLSIVLIQAGDTVFLIAPESVRALLGGIKLSVVGQAIMPAAWLIFALAYSRDRKKEIFLKWSPAIATVFILSAYFISCVNSPDFIYMDYETGPISMEGMPEFKLGSTGKYFHIFLILSLVLNLVQLENTLRFVKSSKRWQVKYIVFGVGSILAFFIYLSSQALLFREISTIAIPIASTVIFFSSSMMALFIFRHKLLHGEIFISRHVFYNSFTILGAGIYLIAVGIITQGIRYFNIPFSYFLTTLFIFLSILSLVAILFSDVLRRKAELFISRNFYRHKYEFKERWMETIERISSKMSIEEIHSTLTEMITEAMGAKVVYVWLYDSATSNFRATHGRLETLYRRISPSHPLIEKINSSNGPFLLADDVFVPGQGEIEGLASATGTTLCSPLAANRELVGFILQGEDISGEPYRQDDFDLLRAMSAQAAVQIKNIGLTNHIMAGKEAEVFNKMSSFVLHDLKNFTNLLSLVSQNARFNMNNPDFQRDAIKAIDGTVSKMKSLIEKLKDAPKGIELKKKECDIKDVLHSALKRFGTNRSKHVSIENNSHIPPLSIDPEAIEMVFLNLLLNAHEAISAHGEIKVTLGSECEYASIKFADNGEGIARDFIASGLFRPFRTTKENGLGIGLYQCKTIIEAHGGQIEVESEEGIGTEFTLRLPLAKKNFSKVMEFIH
ncbi:MAG: PEP-CTERM system histidine kinase PrsK [Deltaproteobacteria bacterium]|nr:PEP-CTERM system histidine kinase PrsK [Deltaproteobacteria bacterium]